MEALLSKQAKEPIKFGLKAEDIHKDFMTEADSLLNGNKGCRLAALGFTSAESAVPIPKHVLEDAAYFKQHYPLYKYITEVQISALCKKYSLVYGEASMYKGDIPEKNLREIEAFKVREKDKQLPTYSSVIRDDYGRYNFNNIPFTICAPVKDMHLSKAAKVDERGFVYIKDPIVIKPIRHGGLIITMWGPEASDPIAINEINN